MPAARPVTGGWPVLAGVTLLAGLLRFWGAGRQSIWVDATFPLVYAGIFEPMSAEKFFINLQGSGHALLLHGWCRLFGDSEMALRSLGALLGTITVPLFYLAVRPLAGAGLALTAAALLAVNPFHIWYSQEIRGYVLMVLAVVGATGLWLARANRERAIRPPARERAKPGGGDWTAADAPRAGAARPGADAAWIAEAAAHVTGLLSNLSYVFVGAVQGAWLLLRGRAVRARWRPFLLAWSAALLCLSPWIVQFYHRAIAPSGALGGAPAERLEEVRGSTATSALGVPYAYFALLTGFSYGPPLRELHEADRAGVVRIVRRHLPALAVAGLVFGVALALGTARLWRAGAPARAWLLLALLPVLAAFVVAQLNIKMMNVRYAASPLPGVMVIVAAGILAPRRMPLRAALMAARLVPPGVSLAHLHGDPAYQKEDARSVAAFLRQEAAPGDLLYIVGTEVPLRDYYWRLPGGRPPGLTVADAWPGYWARTPFVEQTARFEGLEAEHPRTWVLFFRPKDVDREGRWAAWFDQRGGIRRDLRWAGVRLLELAPRGGAA